VLENVFDWNVAYKKNNELLYKQNLTNSVKEILVPKISLRQAEEAIAF